MTQRTARFAYGLLASLFLFSCSDGGDQSGSTGTEDAEPQTVFTHKMMKQVPGEGQGAQFAFECQSCSFEQWLSIEPPPGWERGPAQIAVMDSGNLRSRPSLEQVQAEWPGIEEEDFDDSWDFLEEVPGNEYELIAVNLGIDNFEISPPNVYVVTRVIRDTDLTFDANRRVHEITNGDGDVFVLFAYGVDPVDPVIPDFQDPEVLGDLTLPAGWTYSTRLLEEELVLDSEDIATVLAIRPLGGQGQTSTWEKRE